MGLKKRLKKAIRKIPQVRLVKKVGSMFKGYKDSSSDDSGMRSEAARRLVDTQRQAGSGQINFTTEEYS